MTRRTRKFIIDNTVGSIFSNISNSASATKANVTAGPAPKLKKLSTVRGGKPIVKVNGNKALISKKAVLISNVFLQVTNTRGKEDSLAAPVGGSVTVRLRKVNTSGVETNIQSFSITSGTTSSNTISDIEISETESLFADVTSIGTVKTGTGLNIFLTYYG